MKSVHDQHILRKSFEVGQKVLLYNSRLHLFLGKLQVDGPNLLLFEMSHLMGQLKFKTSETEMFLKSMGHRLKPYLELEQGEIEYVDLRDPLPIE